MEQKILELRQRASEAIKTAATNLKELDNIRMPYIMKLDCMESVVFR